MHYFKTLKQSWQTVDKHVRHLTIGGFAALVLALVIVSFLAFQPEPEAVTPDFTSYAAGEERKAAFFNYFLPLVVERNREIVELRQTLQELRQEDELGRRDERTVTEIAADYGLESFDPDSKEAWTTLMRRVDVIPPSLALAQGANESAWGTSRFARQGNNFYGEWCFVKGCGLVPQSRDDGAVHEVASYDSARESVASYIDNLNQHYAYTELRKMRADLRREDETISGLALADGLGSYSERGDEYIEELEQMIRFNQLAELDAAPAQLPDESK